MPSQISDQPMEVAVDRDQDVSLSRYSRSLGGKQHRVRVHDLRHTFATRLEAAGVSRSNVAEMLGHATSSVTRRYIAPDISRLLHEAEKVVAMRHEPVLRIVG